MHIRINKLYLDETDDAELMAFNIVTSQIANNAIIVDTNADGNSINIDVNMYLSCGSSVAIMTEKLFLQVVKL